jgi:hypothetical protein
VFDVANRDLKPAKSSVESRKAKPTNLSALRRICWFRRLVSMLKQMELALDLLGIETPERM